MKINEDMEITVKLAPHTIETLAEIAEDRKMEIPMLIRLIINEWALKNEQLKNKKDR